MTRSGRNNLLVEQSREQTKRTLIQCRREFVRRVLLSSVRREEDWARKEEGKELKFGRIVAKKIRVMELKTRRTSMNQDTDITMTSTCTHMSCRCSHNTFRVTTGAFSTRYVGCRRNWSGEQTRSLVPVLLLYKATKDPIPNFQPVKSPNLKGACQDHQGNEPAVRHAGSIFVNPGRAKKCAGRREWSLHLFICAAM